jgi:SHS2 domain-containing protein
LELWAPSEAELLEEGAVALVSLLTEGAGPGAGPDSEREVRLEAVDDEDRLVQWLNEILVLAVLEGWLFRGADIELAEPGILRAVLRGRAGGSHRLAGELKSVTYHDLLLTGSGPGWRARIVVDV